MINSFSIAAGRVNWWWSMANGTASHCCMVWISCCFWLPLRERCLPMISTLVWLAKISLAWHQNNNSNKLRDRLMGSTSILRSAKSFLLPRTTCQLSPLSFSSWIKHRLSSLKSREMPGLIHSIFPAFRSNAACSLRPRIVISSLLMAISCCWFLFNSFSNR